MTDANVIVRNKAHPDSPDKRIDGWGSFEFVSLPRIGETISLVVRDYTYWLKIADVVHNICERREDSSFHFDPSVTVITG